MWCEVISRVGINFVLFNHVIHMPENNKQSKVISQLARSALGTGNEFIRSFPS
jgi:hypothetical protein